MKILVTGGAGFIASNVADEYVKLGHEVAVVDDLSVGRRENVNPKCKFYKADVSTPEFSKIVQNEKPDLINHHAAQIDVRKSVDDPQFDARVNIIGMINLCHSAVKAGTKKIIFASSGGVLYGEVPGEPAKESSPVMPACPYGLSKYASEMYLRYYGSEYGLNYTILRYANVYGPRQVAGEAGVVAIFLRAMLKGKPTVIFDDGTQKRDFVFVGDVVRANALSIDRAGNETLNVGTGLAVAVNEIHKILSDLTGYKGERRYEPRRAGELKRSVLSYAAASDSLGWKPAASLEHGLIQTRDWFNKTNG